MRTELRPLGLSKRGLSLNKAQTRRSILKGGLQSTVLALGPASTWFSRSVESVWAEVASDGGESENSVLSEKHRRWLDAVADELIPETDDMPSATAIGGVDFVEIVLRDVPELRCNITEVLEQLATSSQEKFQAGLSQIDSGQRVKLLQAFEVKVQRSAEQGKAPTDLFVILRDLIYEAYYTNPDVHRRLGYEFRQVKDGPRLPAFDEKILAKVRTLPKNYREVE